VSDPASHRAALAVFRIESARLIAGLVRFVRDVGLAEELAQDALLIALERWPSSGIPENPAAWLMTTAKNRAVDLSRRRKLHDENQHELIPEEPPHPDVALDEDVGDDLLRLILISCHPVLSPEARVALTLRLLGGLSTERSRARSW
jgi:predicted RNA polymerase sigma factor